MPEKKYTPPESFANTGDVIYYLSTTKGIRPKDGFAMVTVFVDDETLKFRSHKAAIACFRDIRFHAHTKAFRNFGGGLTLQVSR